MGLLYNEWTMFLSPDVNILLAQTSIWHDHYKKTSNPAQAWAACAGDRIHRSLRTLLAHPQKSPLATPHRASVLNSLLDQLDPNVELNTAPQHRPTNDWMFMNNAQDVPHALPVDTMLSTMVNATEDTTFLWKSRRFLEMIGEQAIETQWDFQHAPLERRATWLIGTYRAADHAGNQQHRDYITQLAMAHAWAWETLFSIHLRAAPSDAPHLKSIWTNCPHPPSKTMLLPLVVLHKNTGFTKHWVDIIQEINPEWYKHAVVSRDLANSLYGIPESWEQVHERCDTLWASLQESNHTTSLCVPTMPHPTNLWLPS